LIALLRPSPPCRTPRITAASSFLAEAKPRWPHSVSVYFSKGCDV
jgi:hypothetical protein